MTARETHDDWDDKLAQILDDPVDAERTPNELAMLEAEQKRSLSLERLSLDPPYRKKRRKIKLILDYNKALQTVQKAESPATSDGLDSSTGFLGGGELTNALGIHTTRLDAFFRQLERKRMSLGDDCWVEVQDPRTNSPQFLYRVDSPSLCELAKAYLSPKSA